MELATPVDSRTKEPFSMDDQSSVTSSLANQATFGEQSNLNSRTSSTPKKISKETIARDLQSGKLGSADYRGGSQPEFQYDPTDRPAALTPVTRPNNRGRSRSPRPVISAEARARWAMLASLAGVSKDENLSEDEEDGQRAPTATNQSPDPFSDPRLRPLHILDLSGDAASIERYLHNLEKDPHVDNRLLQEGLQASKRLSNDYTKGEQAMTRSRGYSPVTEPQTNSQSVWQEGPNRQGERKRPGETSAEQDSQDGHSIVRVEPSVTTSLQTNAQTPKHKSRVIGYGVERGPKEAEVDVKADVSANFRKVEALSHTHGEHGVGEGLDTRVHGIEGTVESIGSELHVPKIRRDVGNDSRDLGLAGRKSMRDFQQDEHAVDAGFRNAERSVENKLPSLDIRHDIRKSEHELNDGFHKLESVNLARDVKKGELKLKEDLHKLEGGDLTRDVRRGEHDLDAGIRRAEKEVESALPGGHILQDVQKGEHEPKLGIRDAEEAIEGAVKGPNFQQAFRRGEHDLGASVNSIAKNAENVLPGGKREIREGEQNLKNSLLRDASKVEKVLSGLDLPQEASEVTADIAKVFRRNADAVERDVRKADGLGLVKKLNKDGQALELTLERLGTSVAGHVSKDEHALVRDTRAIGQSVENAGKLMGRSAGRGARTGEQVVDQAMESALNLRLLDNEGPQGRNRAANNGPASSPKIQPSGTGMGLPATSNQLTDTGKPSRLHSHEKPVERRTGLLNNIGLPNHGLARQNPMQAPFPLLVQHGPVRPPTNPAQLRPYPAPAGLSAPYPTHNEPTRATMPMTPSESHHLSPMAQGSTQGGLGKISPPIGSNKITPNSGQAAGPNPNQTIQALVHSRLAESAQASRSSVINPHLSQAAVPLTESNSFRPDQQRHGGNQSRNQGFQPSPAKPQGDRYQALSVNQPAQLKQPGVNPPFRSNVNVSKRMPPPRVDAANLGSQHRKESSEQDKLNDAPGKGTPPQQGPRPAQTPQGIRPHNLVSRGQHSEQQELGEVVQSPTEYQRKAQMQGGGKVAAKPVEKSVSQTGAHQQEANHSILAFHALETEDEPESQHESHGSIPSSESHSAAKRLSHTSTEVPSPVSGPQLMLNIVKVRSQASIDAAGGRPGFVDQMIQLLCKMGQDAMPEIERRLAANQAQ